MQQILRDSILGLKKFSLSVNFLKDAPTNTKSVIIMIFPLIVFVFYLLF